MAKASTIADKIAQGFSEKRIIPENLRVSLSHRVRRAQRLVMTEEAGKRVGEAIYAYPEMLVEHGIFARPPFDECWIEFPSQGFHSALVPTAVPYTDMTDDNVGYLFSEDKVYIASDRQHDGRVSWSPMRIALNQPSTFESERKLADILKVSRVRFDALYFGEMMSRRLPIDVVRQFRAQHSVEFIADTSILRALGEAGQGDAYISAVAGEVRNVVGLLLMLNQPKIIKYISEVPRRRGMTAKGSKVFLGHSVIEIDLNRKPLTVILGRPQGTHASPKRHNVIGNWANRGLAPLCEHAWEQIDENHFTCANCGGKRWWRKAHKRGKKDQGSLTQERIITASGM